jgi:phage-related protein
MARKLGANERPVDWVGSSKKDFMTFPAAVISEMGYALGVAQLGGTHPSAKPWRGEGSGVFELVEDHDGDTYRAVYTVRFKEVLYMLHAFQKKSKSGIKTPQTDVETVKRRLKAAQEDHAKRFGKK